MRNLVLVVACFVLLAGPAAAQIGPYDHIHLNAPDVVAAGNWYEKYFDAKRLTEGPNRFMFGSTRLVFTQKADAKPSAGSAIDHIGFSVRDIDAKIKELQAADVKVTEPVREVQGLFKIAFIEDPWGTKIEVVQDPDLLGFHHAHLRAPDPEDAFKWLQTKFGGERTKLKGRIDALKYSAPGFSDVWFLVQRGENVPSEGHAIDHIGMRSTGPLAKTIDTLRGQGVTVTTEPRQLTLPNGPPGNIAFVAGPAGVRVEIVERPGLKPGQ
jgi:catechol 2,3-dioxygenase-like lactoylglutathione lyase family enzyme